MTITLSLYPNQLGLGYVCVEMPPKLLDFGILNVRPARNEKIMAQVRRFTAYFRPAIILVRDNAPVTKRGERIERLTREIEEHAKLEGLPVYRYTRKQIVEVFEVFGATTKHEMTQKIIDWFPELANRMPKIRKPWLPENYHMGIFDALALALTHQYLTD